MTINKNKFLLKVLVSILLLSFVLSAEVKSASSEALLKDISGVALVTEILSNSLNKKSLNVEALEKTLGEKIEDSRISLYKQSQWRNKVGGAYLKIKIVSSKLENFDIHAVYIDLELYRPAMILSPKLGENKSIVASNWSTGKLFPCTSDNFHACVEKASLDLIDIFINEYKAVNRVN